MHKICTLATTNKSIQRSLHGKNASFNGFSKDTIKFFEKLRENNNRNWFEQHRDMYESSVLEPSGDGSTSADDNAQDYGYSKSE